MTEKESPTPDSRSNDHDSLSESFLYPEGSRYDSVALPLTSEVGSRVAMLRHAAGYPEDPVINGFNARTVEELLREFPHRAQVGLYLGPRGPEQRSFYEAGEIARKSEQTVHLLTDTSFCREELDCVIINPALVDRPDQADPLPAVIDALADHGRVLVVGSRQAGFITKTDFAGLERWQLIESIMHTAEAARADRTGSLDTLADRFAA